MQGKCWTEDDNMFDIRIVTKYPSFFLLVSLFIAVFFFLNIHKLRNVEDVDHFIIKDDPDNLYYEDFKKVFGNDEFFIICFSDENIFTRENLR